MKAFFKNRVFLDLLIVLIITIVGAIMLAEIDAFERVFDFTRDHEELELDELLLCIPVLAICLSWFSYRRWRDSTNSLRQIEAVKVELIKSNEELDIRVKERTKALEEAQNRLIDQAHKAGMADVAANTLHNVGNLLNNIKTSAQLIEETVERFPIAELKSASMMMEENKDDLENFIISDPKGKMLLEYYLTLGHELTDQRIEVFTHFVRLNEKIDAIVDVISDQYSHSDSNRVMENHDLQETIKDSLSVVSESLEDLNIKIHKKFSSVPKIKINKTKLISILINLARNSQDALTDNPVHNRQITIELKQSDGAILLSFRDNGKGVSDDQLDKIFAFGYTTKKDHRGYGLHACANYMAEMGYRMWAENDESGTSFVLHFGRR